MKSNEVSRVSERNHRGVRPYRLSGRWGALLIFLFAVSAAVGGELLDKTIELDTRANSALEDALIEWGMKVGVTVMMDTRVVDRLQAPRIQGRYNARAALSLLLRGSGLSYVEGGATIRIVPSTNLVRSGLWNYGYDDDLSASSNSPAISGKDGSRKNVTRDSVLEEVVVSAQKREERLLDVPISIETVSSDELSKLNATTSFEDLKFSLPSVGVSSLGDGRFVEIRGVSNFSGGLFASIGQYLDEASVTSGGTGQLSLNTYDLERVEVLRGPQGTLYGAGSSGGTLRFITKNPDLNNLSFATDMAATFTQDGSPGNRIQALLNVPVLDDVLGFRVASTFDHSGGWVDQPAIQRKDINSGDLTDVRLKGLWTPTSEFTVSMLTEVHRDTHGTAVGEDANGNYTQYFGQPTTPRIVENFDILNLTATYNNSRIKILNSISYFKQTFDAWNLGVQILAAPPAPGNPPYQYIEDPNSASVNVLNDEFRISSTGTGPWNWTLGVFGQNFRLGFAADTYYAQVGDPAVLPGAVPPGTLPPVFTFGFNTQSKSGSVFGDTSYKFGNLTLGAGVRYFRDDQNFTSFPPPTTQRGSFTSTDPRFYVQYALAKDANVYASAAKGFRSGGFNQVGAPTFGPEDVWTYETGIKTVIAGRLSANADVYYSKYKNYQIVGFLPPPAPLFGIVRNAGEATIKGVEWDLAWRPTDRWRFSFSGDALTSRFDRLDVIYAGYNVGDQLDFVPKYLWVGSIERDFPWRGRNVFVRLDYSQQGRMTARDRWALGPPPSPPTPWWYGESDVIKMLGSSAGIQLSSEWSMKLFAQNLLNNNGLDSPITYENYAGRPRPRTVGIEFSAQLGAK